MTKAERRGAERMLREILLELKAHRQYLPVYHVEQVGARLLDRDDDAAAVFPGAAELTDKALAPTVRAKA